MIEKKMVFPSIESKLKRMPKTLSRKEEQKAPAKKEKRKISIDHMLSNMDSMMKLIVFLSILGLLISSYLTWLQYAPGEQSLCIGCKTLVRSTYLYVMGIPAPLLSIIGYAVLLLTGLSLLSWHNWKWLYKTFKPRQCSIVLIAFSSVGTLAALWLTYVQAHYWLWCVLCIISSIVIVVILALAVFNYLYCKRCRKRLNEQRLSTDKLCKYC